MTGDEAEYERLRLAPEALARLRAAYRGAGDPLAVLRRRFHPDPAIEARRRRLQEQAFARGGDDGALEAFERGLAADDRELESALAAASAGEEGATARAVSAGSREWNAAPAAPDNGPREVRKPASARLLLVGVAVGAFLLGATAVWAGGRIAQTAGADPLGGEPLVSTLSQVRERQQEERDRLPVNVTARVVLTTTRIIVDGFYPSESMRSPWQVYVGEDTLGYRLCFIALHDDAENSTMCVPEDSADNVRFTAYADNGDTLAVEIEEGQILAATSVGD